ncbi:hypothetical protein HAX54_022871, partial [Datura stramonium]|nr:hypothetical protein [Datura stramonium]
TGNEGDHDSLDKPTGHWYLLWPLARIRGNTGPPLTDNTTTHDSRPSSPLPCLEDFPILTTDGSHRSLEMTRSLGFHSWLLR